MKHSVALLLFCVPHVGSCATYQELGSCATYQEQRDQLIQEHAQDVVAAFTLQPSLSEHQFLRIVEEVTVAALSDHIPDDKENTPPSTPFCNGKLELVLCQAALFLATLSDEPDAAQVFQKEIGTCLEKSRRHFCPISPHLNGCT